jgi:hypothetical protein
LQEIENPEVASQAVTSRVQPNSHPAAPVEDDDDVVEVEENGAVKVEKREEQAFEYSNDGTDVR